MKLLWSFLTVFFTVLASSSLISVALITYGLRSHGSKLLSGLLVLIWMTCATACLRELAALKGTDGLPK